MSCPSTEDAAHLLLARQRDAKGTSHFGAAAWILDDLEKSNLASCSKADRVEVLAMLGTRIANLGTLMAAH